MSLHNAMHNIEKSAIFTFIGIVLLFSTAVIAVLVAPNYVEQTWTQPTNPYQVQVYEVADPNLYISRAGGDNRQFVYHMKQDYTLLAFQETETLRIVATPELERYVTRNGDPHLKLTARLLMLRPVPLPLRDREKKLQLELQQEWEKQHPLAVHEKLPKPAFQIMELYAPEGSEAFALAPSDSLLENWVDKDYTILDGAAKQPYHLDPGVIYVANPIEYRAKQTYTSWGTIWLYDPRGEAVASLQQLTNPPMNFVSRRELISIGEHIYNIEGCWYCHTDQTRTLVQDVVLNGSESFPAPPSSPGEYIYQEVTFPGTRRIGPDLSRVGVKRPSRDWHKGHFWAPKTASKGSIMPSFKHFFDDDPSGGAPQTVGVPNYQFEAIYQYLVTKGTRITPPTEAWWLGKDPIKTLEIIEGQRKLP